MATKSTCSVDGVQGISMQVNCNDSIDENNWFADDKFDANTQKKKTKCSEVLKKRILFDAINIQFHLLVFLKILSIHLFLPSLIFVKNRKAFNITLRKRQVYYNILSPIMVYTMIGIYFAACSHDKELLNHSLWIPLIFFISHRMTIALKYATLSETEFQRYIECTDEAVRADYATQMQLLTGWHKMDADVLYFEIASASARIGERINHMHLIIRPEFFSVAAQTQFRYWNAFLRGHDYIQLDSKPAPELKLLPCGNYALSVYDLCLAIVRKANQEGTIDVDMPIFVVVSVFIILVLTPVVSRIHEVQNPYMVCVYLFCVININFTFGYLYFYLLHAAMVDAIRQYTMVSTLHCMIRLTELMMDANLTFGMQDEMSRLCAAKASEQRRNDIFSITDRKSMRCYHSTEGEELYDVRNSSLRCYAFYSDATPQAVARRLVHADNIVGESGEGSEEEYSKLFEPQTAYFARMSDLNNQNNLSAAAVALISAENNLSHNPMHSFGIANTTRSVSAKLRRFNAENAREIGADNDQEQAMEEHRISRVLGERQVKDLSLACPPRMAFEFPQNILAWTYARLTIQNYGTRFRYRIGTYVGE